MYHRAPLTKLAKVLEDQDRSQSWLAKKLQVTRQSAGEWVTGAAKCPLARQAQIAIHTGQPAAQLFDAKGFAIREE